MSRSISKCCSIALLCILLVVHPSSAIASIHKYPETSDQMMWRSLQTLRDRADRAWQVIVYKRINAGQAIDLNLRLVGFPGQVELVHPSSVAIETGTGKTWAIPETTTTPDLPSNAGEYDVRLLLSDLTADIPLELVIPTVQKPAVKLLVPPFVVKEWRQIAQQH